MREDNLLSLRAKPFVPRTTDSRHGFAVRSNLTRGLTPTGLDQIWVADITYVRLAETFVYLAVVIDAFSRKVVGFALDDHLEARLALAALDQAIAARNPAPDSLIHHSDRGVQYACADYVERLERHKIAVSMSRPGNPYDNAKAESFMKTLKTEEVNGKAMSTSKTPVARSAPSSKSSTTPSACTRRSAINPRLSSKLNSAGPTTANATTVKPCH
jgi:putative transposase